MRDTLSAMRDLELAMQALYELYAQRFAAQRSFWTEQVRQEAMHAELIEEVLKKTLWQPVQIVGLEPAQLDKDLQRVRKIIDDFAARDDLSAREAMDTAIDLEIHTSELHNLSAIEQELDAGIIALINRLQAEDEGHVQAIQKLRDALPAGS